MNKSEFSISALAPLLPPRSRTVILGVGAQLRRDDYAGMAVARELMDLSDGVNLLVVEGSNAPENCVGQIRGFSPDALLVVDAAHMGRQPGEYAILDPREITGATFSTHMLPLPVTLSYIEACCDCVCAYIGIEPVDTGEGIGMDPAVARGVQSLAAELRSAMES